MPLVKSKKTLPSTSSTMRPLACFTAMGAVLVPVVSALVSRSTVALPLGPGRSYVGIVDSILGTAGDVSRILRGSTARKETHPHGMVARMHGSAVGFDFDHPLGIDNKLETVAFVKLAQERAQSTGRTLNEERARVAIGRGLGNYR